jgi:hypothetical protein
MKKLIRKILHEVVAPMDELDQKFHSKERVMQRLSNKENLEVRAFYKKPNEGFKFKRVGTYTIPEEVKQIIQKKINYILTIDVDPTIKLGVIIHKFRLGPNNVNFYDLDTRNEAMKLLVNYDGEFYLHDEETSSTGNVFFCVINENSIITSYYTGSFSLNPEKYRVDKIIEVDDLLDFKV